MRLDYEMAYNRVSLEGKALSEYSIDELVGYYMSKGSMWPYFLEDDIVNYQVSSVRARAAKEILICLGFGG